MKGEMFQSLIGSPISTFDLLVAIKTGSNLHSTFDHA